MTRAVRFAVPVLLMLVLVRAALAQTPAPALDVRVGLWEITSVSHIGGELPTVDTSKMAPAQKAQLEAAMKSAMGDHTDTSKSCLTKQDLDKASFMMRGDKSTTCTQAFVSNTKTLLESDVTCDGEHSMKGHLRVEAPAPTAMEATMNTTTTTSGRTMKVDVSMSGKWLAADCGTVK
jgi:hypothetical protein